MIIIMDSRERIGFWTFAKYDGIDGQVVQKLDAGDYAIYEKPLKIAIERKKTPGELANNLGKDYKQFNAEFERMQKYEQRYCICEFTLDDMLGFPNNSTLSDKRKRMIKMNGKFMLKRVNELEEKYGVKFIFCKDRQEAEETALELFMTAIQ